jgi:hypothetical protein
MLSLFFLDREKTSGVFIRLDGPGMISSLGFRIKDSPTAKI